jgi:hypothetical protein
MRRRLKRLWTRLKQLSTMALSREELLMKLGAARDQSRTAWRLVTIEIAADSATFSYRLDRTKLRQTRSREGRYLLRTNLAEEDPAKLWSHYLLLVVVEEAFKNLKSLPLRKQGAISRSGRSFTSARRASRPTSSLPSWPIACTSRWRGACMRYTLTGFLVNGRFRRDVAVRFGIAEGRQSTPCSHSRSVETINRPRPGPMAPVDP